MDFLLKLLGLGGYETLSVYEYRKRFDKGRDDHLLVDVRTPDEYKRGHLPRAINIPLADLKASLDRIPGDRPVVVVCAAGNRSRMGAARIARAGRELVYNLEGGTNAWVRAGMSVRR